MRIAILVLVTENEKTYIYISPDLLDEQISDLSIFLLNKKQSKIYIETNKSSFFNLLSISFLSISNFSFLRFSFTFLIYCFVIFMFIVHINIGSKKAIYIFNKESDKFQALKISNKKVLLKIPLNEIKQVYLVENIYVNETEQISLTDNVYEEIITTRRSNLAVSYTIKLYSVTNTEFISISIDKILSKIIDLDYGIFFISCNKYNQIRNVEAHKFADLIRCFLQLNFYQSIVEMNRIIEE